MPFYLYHCDKCGEFEVRYPITDSPLQVCPTCGEKVKQVFSPPTVIWRGNFRWMKGNPEYDFTKETYGNF